MKPGVHVAIDTSKANKPEIKGWLSEKVKANQWVEDPNAEIVLSAEMGRGKTETITYRRFGRRGHEAPQKASYRPYYARLKLTQGEKVVWSSNRSSSPPHMIKEGNIQQLVTAEMVPQTGHFERVKIDPLIIDPKYSRGFGVSTLGISGIKVTSTSPPGRTDDPANDVQDEGGEDEQNPDAQ